MNSEDRIRGGEFSIILASFLLFYKIRPYFFWRGIFSNNYFNAIITIILGMLFFINMKKMSKPERLLMLLFSAILISYPFVGDQNFNVFVSIAPLVFLPFAKDIFNHRVFDALTNIYCVIIAVSLFVWVFAIAGILQPYKIISPLNELKMYNYKVYPLLVIDESGRFSGPFDEPGVIGTISGLMLCGQPSFKEKKSIILLLSGICSLSLFFYVIIAIYFSYLQLVANRSSKGLLVFFVAAIIGVIAITSSPILSEMILSRLAFDSDTGMIAGDNRNSRLALELFESIIGTRQFWLGIEDKWEFHEQVAFSSSILNVILMNGMLFVLAIIVFYFVYGWVNKISISAFLVYFIIFMGTLYQRPYIFNPEYIFLWTFFARKDSIHNLSINLVLPKRLME